MEVRTVEPTGDVNRDAVLSGVAWASNALTFGFPTSAAQFTGYSSGQEPFDNFGVLNPLQQSVARSILASLSSFTNLVFGELTGGAEGSAVLRFGRTDDNAT